MFFLCSHRARPESSPLSFARMTGRGAVSCENAPVEPLEPETTMDINSLAAAHMPTPRRPAPTDPGAEERYWRAQASPPRPDLRLPVSIATTAEVILPLIGIAQA
jgi:hypothetical protein